MKNEKKEVTEFTGFDFDDKLLKGLKTDFDNLKIIDTGRPATGSTALSDDFFNEKMIQAGKNIQDILFGKI